MWESSKSKRITSFFSRSKLDLRTLIILIYEWSRKTEINYVCHKYQIDKKKATDLFRFMTDVCYGFFNTVTVASKIGGAF